MQVWKSDWFSTRFVLPKHEEFSAFHCDSQLDWKTETEGCDIFVLISIFFPGILFVADSCSILLLHNTTLLLFDWCLIMESMKLQRNYIEKRKIMLAWPSSISTGLFLVINSTVQKEQEEIFSGIYKDCKGSWIFCKMES